jgi:hypothetical protein
VTTVKLSIDDLPYSFEVAGDFHPGFGGRLIHNLNKFPDEIQKNGFKVTEILSNSEFEKLYKSVQLALYKVINNVTDCKINHVFKDYQFIINDQLKHQAVIQETRNFQNQDFDFDLDLIAYRIGKDLKLNLSSHNSELAKSHVQLRISRPNSLDINPPHRDAYLSYYKDVINVWIPIFGCNSKSSLPVWEGSHLIAEDEILLTESRNAKIDGNTYVVPCVVPKATDTIFLKRPMISTGSALVFSPYLIHGAAFNSSDTTRFSLELRLSIL